MTTVPLRRAYHGETWHRHIRVDGWGVQEHQHPVRAEVHGHAGSGLRQTRLSWAVWRWTDTRSVALFTLATGLQIVAVIVLAVALVSALWIGFAQ